MKISLVETGAMEK